VAPTTATGKEVITLTNYKPLTMAVNSGGQNRNSNRRKGNSPAPKSHEIEKRNRSPQGLRDTGGDRVRSDRTPRSPGSLDKTNFTSTDYDGQLSDE